MMENTNLVIRGSAFSFFISSSLLFMSVVVTGSCGHIGRKVVSLLSKSHALRLTDIREGTIGSQRVQAADLMDLDSVVRIFTGAKTVVHFAIASYGSPGRTMSDQELRDYHRRMLDVNIRGVYHVYEAARMCGVRRVVFVSSLTVAYDGRMRTDCRPDRPPRPYNLYACTKLFGENVGGVYWRNFGIESIVLRLGQPYPFLQPREEEWKKDPFIASWFVTAADIARAVEAALTVKQTGFGIYNVVSPSSHNCVEYASGAEIGFVPLDRWETWDEETCMENSFFNEEKVEAVVGA